MLQDMGDAENCFLSQPEWRDMFRDNAKGLPYLSLRAAFCDMLIHIHELLLEISELPILDDGQLNTRTRHESNAIRAMRINDDIKN
jgi:hypothetical protein